MIKIERFVCNMLEENCYVVHDETQECVIIDCGAYYEEDRKAIVNFIANNNLKPVRLLSTHGHLDHNFGNGTIFKAYGLKAEASEKDCVLMENLDKQATEMFGIELNSELPPLGDYLNLEEPVKFGNNQFEVIETPGHTGGSVTFYCREENIAFTGDTLFKGSIGRTDFPGGSMFQIIGSLRKLSQLPDQTEIYPGHGPKTTIGFELSHNPYMDR